MEVCEISGLGIHIKVADINKSRKFYESLGFRPVFAYGDEEFLSSLPSNVPSAPERYRGLTYSVGNDASLEIAEGHIAVSDRSVFTESIKSPKVSAMVRVSSLAPILKNDQVNLKFPIRHYYWGTLEAAFRDPDGFVLVFIAPYSEKELKVLRKHTEVEEVLAN
jgi:catechol 2,3-dioxygenase-like lactoylglutathione lyase family enzyme